MKEIIMYTTKTWPHCTTAKEFLREKGYSFIEKDVNEDKAARDDFAKRGLRGVPAFIIGKEVVEGLDRGRIEKLMTSNVIACSNCETKLRIPKGKGKIKITCPKCKYEQKIET